MQVQPEKDALTHDLLRQNGGDCPAAGEQFPVWPVSYFFSWGAPIFRERSDHPERNANTPKKTPPPRKEKCRDPGEKELDIGIREVLFFSEWSKAAFCLRGRQ